MNRRTKTRHQRGKKETKDKNQAAALVPALYGGLVEVLERVLTKGVVVEAEEETVDASDAGGGASPWLRVSVAGVTVLKVEAGLSWRYLPERDEKETE